MRSRQPLQSRFNLLKSKILAGLLTFWVVLFVGLYPCFAAGLQVVAHPDNPLTSIKISEITQIYLGKNAFWDSGEKIIPLDLVPLKKVFYEKLLKKRVALIDKYWIKAILSGKGTPPKEFKKISDLVNFVLESPGTIAYLPKEADAGKLKVIRIAP